MATLFCCGAYRKARSHRLVSKDSDYSYQRVYIIESCPKGNHKTMQWRGESHDGTLSEFFDIDSGAHAQWERRVKTEEARPEVQRASEYSLRISGDVTSQIQYQLKITQAARWYKGQRV